MLMWSELHLPIIDFCPYNTPEESLLPRKVGVRGAGTASFTCAAALPGATSSIYLSSLVMVAID